MVEGPKLTEGFPADLEGEPCPPQLIRWLATLDDDLLLLLDTIANEGEGAWLVGGWTKKCLRWPRDRWLLGAKILFGLVDGGGVGDLLWKTQ